MDTKEKELDNFIQLKQDWVLKMDYSKQYFSTNSEAIEFFDNFWFNWEIKEQL